MDGRGGRQVKVLIIGGTRFIGRHLVPKLLERGDQVTVFHRGQTPAPAWAGVTTVHGDRKRPDDLRQLTGQDYDAVVDTVIYTPEEAERAVELFSERVGHYIMISTGNVYQLGRLPGPHREDDPLEDDSTQTYGHNKRLAEDVLFAAFHANGFPAVSLRMPSIYGPWDYQAREWYFIKRLLDGRTRFLLPDAGLGVFHREYAGNIADQLLLLMSTGASRGEAYNAGHRHFQTCAELLRMAARLQGRTVEIYSLPRGKMPWPIALAPGIVYYQPSDKLAALGYREAVDLAEGWQLTARHFAEHPVLDWQFQRSSPVNLFDYQREDQVIAEQAVEVK